MQTADELAKLSRGELQKLLSKHKVPGWHRPERAVDRLAAHLANCTCKGRVPTEVVAGSSSALPAPAKPTAASSKGSQSKSSRPQKKGKGKQAPAESSLGHFGDLPFELFLEVLSHLTIPNETRDIPTLTSVKMSQRSLDIRAAFRLRRVSKFFSNIMSHPSLWQNFTWSDKTKMPLDPVLKLLKETARRSEQLKLGAIKNCEIYFDEEPANTPTSGSGPRPRPRSRENWAKYLLPQLLRLHGNSIQRLVISDSGPLAWSGLTGDIANAFATPLPNLQVIELQFQNVHGWKPWVPKDPKFDKFLANLARHAADLRVLTLFVDNYHFPSLESMFGDGDRSPLSNVTFERLDSLALSGRSERAAPWDVNVELLADVFPSLRKLSIVNSWQPAGSYRYIMPVDYPPQDAIDLIDVLPGLEHLVIDLPGSKDEEDIFEAVMSNRAGLEAFFRMFAEEPTSDSLRSLVFRGPLDVYGCRAWHPEGPIRGAIDDFWAGREELWRSEEKSCPELRIEFLGGIPFRVVTGGKGDWSFFDEDNEEIVDVEELWQDDSDEEDDSDEYSDDDSEDYTDDEVSDYDEELAALGLTEDDVYNVLAPSLSAYLASLGSGH